jgi:hypothetical protein
MAGACGALIEKINGRMSGEEFCFGENKAFDLSRCLAKSGFW